MSGLNPLTWECFDAWQRATQTTVYPHEARALMTLDLVMCYPDKVKDEE